MERVRNKERMCECIGMYDTYVCMYVCMYVCTYVRM
jgi:hypothetical protein